MPDNGYNNCPDLGEETNNETIKCSKCLSSIEKGKQEVMKSNEKTIVIDNHSKKKFYEGDSGHLIAIISSLLLAFISIITLYYSYYYRSENLGVILIGYQDVSFENQEQDSLENNVIHTTGLVPELAFTNAGNKDVFVTDVEMRFFFNGTDIGGAYADHASLLIPPETIRQLSPKFSLGQARSQAQIMLSAENSTEEQIRFDIVLIIKTINYSGEKIDAELEAGNLIFYIHSEDGLVMTYGHKPYHFQRVR